MQYFVKFMESDNTKRILQKPKAFALLAQIAIRCQKSADTPNKIGLVQGEALIGDYASVGLTKKEYRTAKNQLEKWEIVALRRAPLGTVAKIIDKSIFDISRGDEGTLEGTPGAPEGHPEGTRGAPNQEGRGKNGKDKSNTVGKLKYVYSEAFALFWNEWPSGDRKVKKAAAFRIWKKKRLDESVVDVIAGLRWWKIQEAWTKEYGQFVPHPTTFLNQDHWIDVKDEKVNKANNKETGGYMPVQFQGD